MKQLKAICRVKWDVAVWGTIWVLFVLNLVSFF